MAVAFGRGCGFASGPLLGATGPPDGILQLEGEANFSLSKGMKRTQKLLCMGLFSKKLNGPLLTGQAVGARAVLRSA